MLAKAVDKDELRLDRSSWLMRATVSRVRLPATRKAGIMRNEREMVPTVHVFVYRLVSPCLNCPSSTVDILSGRQAWAALLVFMTESGRVGSRSKTGHTKAGG